MEKLTIEGLIDCKTRRRYGMVSGLDTRPITMNYWNSPPPLPPPVDRILEAYSYGITFLGGIIFCLFVIIFLRVSL